jgi:hypothetical protein
MAKKKPKVEFQWRTGFPFQGDPNETGLELTRLSSQHGGLTRELVLEEAMAGNLVLAQHFNFVDIEGAARRHWLDQAQQLILACETVYVSRGQAQKVVAFVNVRYESRRVYIPSGDAMASEDLSEQVEIACRSEIRSLRKRYEQLLGLQKVLAMIHEEFAEEEEAVPVS